MKRGFTILELLVASLLLGMLMTILTMIFNQSAIAWRTGKAGISDLDNVRKNFANVLDGADNAYVWRRNTDAGSLHRLVSLWDDTGALRTRAVETSEMSSLVSIPPTIVGLGSDTASGSAATYMINVKSAGPDRIFDTYDDVWSNPDDFD